MNVVRMRAELATSDWHWSTYSLFRRSALSAFAHELCDALVRLDLESNLLASSCHALSALATNTHRPGNSFELLLVIRINGI